MNADPCGSGSTALYHRHARNQSSFSNETLSHAARHASNRPPEGYKVPVVSNAVLKYR